MATIKEVARLAGVSVGTVSHVLTKSITVSEPLRRKVQAAIEKLDYHPNHVARSLKTNRTRTLGMVVPDMTVSFFPQLIRGAESAAREKGYSLIAANSYEDAVRQSEVLGLFRSQRVDGILLVLATGPTPIGQITKLLEAGIKLVSLDRVPDRVPLDSVSVDNEAAAALAVNHLLERGYRRIAIVTGPLALRNERRRLAGYKKALQEAGVAVAADLVWNSTLKQEDVAVLCAQKLSSNRERPDAILSTTGPTGLGVLTGLQRCGLKTPEDIGLVTFDELTDSDLFSPAVTAIVQPAFDIGFRASQILLGRLNGKGSGKRILTEALPASLKIRESSRARQTPLRLRRS